MPTIGQFTVRTPAEIRDSILRVIRNGLIARGVPDPDVSYGSDNYVRAEAIALQCSVTEANCVIKCDAFMPDTATGEDLARWLAAFGQSYQPAGPSIGGVVLKSSQSTTIVTGSQLIDEFGQHYEVALGGVYSDGSIIQISAIDVGDSTNHPAGDILRWVNTPLFADDKAAVSPGGLINGADADTDDSARARLFAFWQTPPASGNWEHVCELAEKSSPRVEKAFCYPAAGGPATYHVAVIAQPTKANKSRAVASIVVAHSVKPFIDGKMPPHSDNTTTSVLDVPADVSIALSLPEAPTAQPAGLGGGWKDGSPWPKPDATTDYRTQVVVVTSELEITVDAPTAPTAGATHIAFVNPTTWTVYRALVVSYTGTAGAYSLVLDAPLVGVAVGSLIFPDCENLTTYVDAVLAAFASMGPGEKTNNASALLRGYRHPPPQVSWPYSLGPWFVRAITNSSEEVADGQFNHRATDTDEVIGPTGVLAPPLPPTLDDPPRILIPRRIAFYRIPT